MKASNTGATSSTASGKSSSSCKSADNTPRAPLASTHSEQTTTIATQPPKYPTKAEGNLPIKKRKVLVNEDDSFVPTTILLRQVASCWKPPATVSRESSPSSGNAFYLQRYGETVEHLYPKGPRSMVRDTVQPCADPLDLLRSHVTNLSALAVAKKTAKVKNSSTISLEANTKAHNKSLNNCKPTIKEKPAVDNKGESKQGVSFPRGGLTVKHATAGAKRALKTTAPNPKRDHKGKAKHVHFAVPSSGMQQMSRTSVPPSGSNHIAVHHPGRKIMSPSNTTNLTPVEETTQPLDLFHSKNLSLPQEATKGTNRAVVMPPPAMRRERANRTSASIPPSRTPLSF